MKKFSAISIPPVVYTSQYGYTSYLDDGVNYPYQIFTRPYNNSTFTSIPFITLNCKNPTFSPNFSKIQFIAATAPANSPTRLYTVDWDGNNLVQCTTDDINMPSWHPDNNQIVFCTVTASKVERINADGTGRTVLYTPPSGSVYNASYNFDGSKIAFIRLVTGVYSLWVMDADGSSPTQIKTAVFTSDEYVYCWANLSNKLVYVTTTSRFNTILSDGTSDTEIHTPGGSFYLVIRRKCWYPDDSKIVTCKYINSTVGWQLWTVNTTPTNNASLTTLYTTGAGFTGPYVLGSRVYFRKFTTGPTVQTLSSVDLSGADYRVEQFEVTSDRISPN